MSPRQLALVPPGTDVGGYTVEKKLGAGGFGAVYLARRGGRLYALKLIPLWGLGEWAEREVAILLRLKQPNLVRIRGHGQWPDESPRYFFIAMDYVGGRRLDVWAKAENPTAREVVRKVLGVARGLKASHEIKVVHRDLKESNIVVRASDGEAVLVDFGAGGYESAPSITGGVLPPGTPEYRAPEAWRFQQEHGDKPGASYQPGPSDDLYALGVVLYWLLTGRQPFLPDEAAGVEAVLNRAPKPPHVLNPRVPKALGDVCMRLLAKRPEERPPSADALCAELEALLVQEDECCNVNLCDAYGPDTATTLAAGPLADDDELVQWLKKAKARPRRGLPPPPEEDEQEGVPHNPVAEAELPMAAGARVASMSVLAAPSARVGAMRALRAAAWASILVLFGAGVLVLASTLRLFPAPAPEHHVPEVAAPSLPALPDFTLPTWAPGQEVATPWMRPEAHEATDPPKAASTPAAVAVRATFTKDKASVKMKKNTGTPPPPEQPNEVGSVSKALGLGLAACLGLACPGPQVRPAPPPEDCPSGAAAAMDKLGIKTGATMFASFRLRAGESESAFIPVRAGSTTVRLHGPLGNLPGNTLVVGKLIVGEERVYGRFTEARTPQDERFPVCFQILDEEDHAVGAKKRPNGGAEARTIYSEVKLKAVRRFE